MLKSNVFKTALLALLACMAFATLNAQTVTTGDITGVVSDQTGAVVPSATVSLKNMDNGQTRTLTTGGSGEYRFTTLQPGNYQVSAAITGLKSTSAAVTVEIGQVNNVLLTLTPSSSTEIVTVTDVVPLLSAENANLATSFNQKQLENLPAPGNDMTAYAYTAPGVTLSTGGGYGNFSVFGLPGVSNLFTVNGNDNMDPYLNLNNSGASNLTLGSNEIGEVAVVTNGYTGQYGRQAGANVNYVTKSGTNQFHGNAAWFYNERVLNANDWFLNSTPNQGAATRPFAISNEWADSIGGPIVKNKLFFFFDNEGLRYVLSPGGSNVYIPTTDFTNYVLGHLAATNPAAVPFYQKAFNLYAGSSGAAHANNVTPDQDPSLGCGDIDPVANAGFGSTLPCARSFRNTTNNLNTEWLMAIKGDYNITNNDRIYMRYNQDKGVQATGTDPINPAFNANSVQPSWGGQFGYTRVISASQVNQLLLSGTYYSAIFGPPDLSKALSTFPTTFAFVDGSPFSNVGGGDNVYPQGRKVRQWQLIDDYSLTHGSHTLKFGTNVRKNFVATYAYGANTSGLFTFNSMTDFLNGALSSAGGSTYSQSFTNIGAENLQMYSAGFYGQDEWKIKPNLTVTLAIRFDRNSDINCGVGCFNEFGTTFGQADHTSTTPYNSVVKTGLHSAFPNVETVVPAPRIGIAYSPNSSTVIRGGFGIFSDLYQGLIADRMITNSPAVASFTGTSGLVALNTPGSAFALLANSASAFQNGFASGATVSQLQQSVPGFAKPNFNTVTNRLLNPKYYEWNFEVQKSFTPKYMVSANYVGNKGYDEINQNLFGNSYSAKNFQGLPASAPDSRFGEIRELNNAGWSNYNGVVGSFKWRMSSDFTGAFSYTYSHALDTCSNSCLEPFNALSSVSLRYQISPLGLRAVNYGNADYDVRHSLNANYVYTLSPSHFQNGILKAVMGGWTAAGTFFYHSGYPFSVVDSGVRSAQGIKNASGIATQPFIADYLGGLASSSCTTPNITCFSTAAFALAANQHDYGNTNRNAFRGPGYFDTDLNVNRVFSVRERVHLLIGAYFFNVLNHPNFDLPFNNVASSGTFGQIQSTVSAPSSAYGSFQGSAVSGRVIQMQVKLTF